MSQEPKEDDVMFKCNHCGKEGDLTSIYWWDSDDEAAVCCTACENVMRFSRDLKKVIYDYELIGSSKGE